MASFPKDAPKKRVIRAFNRLGFKVIREREHISLERSNENGSTTPLTLPNHPKIKGSTLRSACNQSGISRKEFLKAYEQS